MGRWTGRLGLIFASAALLLVVLGRIAPFRFTGLRTGLDPSWVAVISEAHSRGWRFGTDIVFTGGPLSSLYTHYFQQETAVLALLLGVVLVLYLTLSLAFLPESRTSLFPFAAAVVLAFAATTRDALLLGVPLLLAAITLKQPDRTNWFFLGAGTLASAASILAKFSAFPVVLVVCVVLDGVAVAHKRPPLHLLLAGAFCATLFALSGQDPADLADFIQSSLQTSVAFSGAMGISGPSAELWIWLAAALAFGCLCAEQAWRGVIANRRYRLAALARAFVFCIFLFVAFKAGFVRHDGHSLIAWSALVIAGVVHAGTEWPLSRRVMRADVAAAVILIAFAAGHLRLHGTSNVWQGLNPAPLIRSSLDQIAQARAFVAAPGAWLEKHRLAKEQSYEKVRAAQPLPELDGPADMIPSEQSAMIANRLDYRPRPTVQEYTSHSEPLIERNRQFFTGPRAPKYVFFAPGSIDGRHPASAEGALWPLFLRLYEPVDRVRDMVLLRRRANPLGELVEAAQRRTGKLDEPIRLPRPHGPVFMALDIQPTFAGRLLELVFKPPMMTMAVGYSDGTKQTHRIIPSMAGAGMIVAPFVGSSTEFLLLASGDLAGASLKWPETVRLFAHGFGSSAYAPDIAVSFSRLDVKALREAAARSDFFRRWRPDP